MKGRRILIVDDEPLIGASLQEALQNWNYDATFLNDGQEAIEHLRDNSYDMVLTDVRMPNITGMQILEHISNLETDTAVIMITAFGTIDHAVEAMKKGAYDYITKPFSLDAIRLCLERYFKNRALEEENRNLRKAIKEKYALDNFIGEDAKIKEMFTTLEMAFESDAPVFIQSEHGTGKELIASAIHFNSERKGRPFLKINCASIPEHLIESQLFGHEKGAFTGAIKAFKGVFEEAHGGTLLLDEITEMPTHLQAKLLRVLQEGEFTRLGSTQTMQTDVRIVATSNCDVQKAIEQEKFRQDLFFRLDVISVRIPPLRERRTDIPLLCQHFIQLYAKKYGKEIFEIEPDAIDFLNGYHWPGNVRELENVIQRSVLSCRDSNRIALDQILLHWPKASGESDVEIVGDQDLSIDEMEKRLIASTLKRHNFHKTRTAEILGVTLKTLRNKIVQYDLKPQETE